VGRRMSAARMRGERAHLGCTHMFVYSSPRLWIAKTEFSESMIARMGIDYEGGRPTTSCRKCLIDESNGKLDLLVKARQPTCSCNARGRQLCV